MGDGIKVVLEGLGKRHDNQQSVVNKEKLKKLTQKDNQKQRLKMEKKTQDIVTDLHLKMVQFLRSFFK